MSLAVSIADIVEAFRRDVTLPLETDDHGLSLPGETVTLPPVLPIVEALISPAEWRAISVASIDEVLENLEEYGHLRFTWAADGERLRFSVAEYQLGLGGFIGVTRDLEVNNTKHEGELHRFVMTDLLVPRISTA